MRQLPPDFDSLTQKLLAEADSVEGFLSPREMRFLMLLAACPTASGEILEIGSFKGKSTIILAKSTQLAGDGSIVNAVDPMTAPSETDPDLRGETSSLADFERNLAAHGVSGNVRFHKMFSHELAADWDKPLRLLWIDGDHTYAGTKRDLECFAPHLADRGIVAIHDVLHEFEGGARVFAEHILSSPQFGACGFCGSIGWAQYHDVSPAIAARPLGRALESRKKSLLRKLDRLRPFLESGKPLAGLRKLQYKFYRFLIPHGSVDPQAWLDEVDPVLHC